jgi:aminoacrylate hydrolase
MPQMSITDGTLYYEIHGDGPPLILAAGLGGVGSFWASQLPALTPHFKVVLYDHRGTGQSSRDRITYSLAQMARDVIDLADGLGIERFHFAGHSTGSAIGQELAMHHGGRLLSAALSSGWARCDPWFTRCFETRATLLKQGGPAAYVKAQALFLYPPWWVSAHNDQLEKLEAAQIANFPPPEIMFSRVAAITSYGPGEALAAITTPTLVVCADDDHLTPPHFSVAVHRLIPGSALAILPTGGHFNPVTQTAAFNAVLLGWLLAQHAGTAWTPPPGVRQDTAHHG